MRLGRKNPVYASLNGRLLLREKAAIPVTDAGYLLGLGVFETVRVEDGVPLFLEDHLKRLAIGLHTIKIEKPAWDPAGEIDRVIEKNRIATAVIRITVSGGPPGGPSTLVIVPRPIPELKLPIHIGISPYPKDPKDAFAGLKTTSRLLYGLTHRWAESHGCFDALIPNHQGDLAEGSISNLFCVMKGLILTPPLSRGILAGVTRGHLLSICKRRKFPFKESPLTLRDLERADEIFLSNTSRGVLPVDRIRGLRRTLPGLKGPVAVKLQELYIRRVELYKKRH
ncbi:MAG: aminotransferase class IV [Candidatus Eisenbacteria bacterium]|uniref:Aminotransferase class IV n=1 Tax=Eiseniibacteriota bacterium TaxID=2212470 RepID=A0A948RYS9_UNCEI|nr:aminotransferase class IV [Candidatus Eisenbacteria bacterium]MBU1949569.1 aminotransferase class IV [Candidatus Eisenbacteria bacterium]MBU2692102.1 aminotransferase class IV [Candidatus Eisenbacteria bacterium]